MKPVRIILGLLLAAASAGAAADGAALRPFMPRASDFTMLYWLEGPEHVIGKSSGAQPVLCLQSGTIGLALDTRTLRVIHLGKFRSPLNHEAALRDGPKELSRLPRAQLVLELVNSGNTNRCVGRIDVSSDPFFYPVRFIESGRFFQRAIIEDLRFAGTGEAAASAVARLEIAFWPDRLTLTAELREGTPADAGRLVLRVAGQHGVAEPGVSGRVTLTLFEGEPVAPVEAENEMGADWDPGLGAWVMRPTFPQWTNARGTYYPEEELDRLDRFRVVFTNDSALERVARVMVDQVSPRAITGFCYLWCDPDGTPAGVPVQISKNWHANAARARLPNDGAWARGFSYVRVPPKSRREFLFTTVYARWGGVPSASHAQLCLVGWGHNQFWEQAAIGSFGESICYEPGRVQRRCFVDDIRPLMTLPAGGEKPFGWARNAGGGDFLVWIDEAGTYRGFRRTRTFHHAQGPCLTDVSYSEETAGGEVRARMRVSLARSDDYLRAFHRLRYDVRRPVTWDRLAFYQLGADYYNSVPARNVAFGNASGLSETWQPILAKDRYDRKGVPLRGTVPWISVYGVQQEKLAPGDAAASRGLIIRSWKAVLGGKRNEVPHLSTFATEWHRGDFKTVIELSPPPGVSALRPGDFVEAELEMVTFPVDSRLYYGPDRQFRAVLEEHGDSWVLTAREAGANSLWVEGRTGTVHREYPVGIRAGGRGAFGEFTGGVGWIPVTHAGLDDYRGWELLVDGKPLDQSVHGNDFWQTDYDTITGKWQLTHNVRPGPLGVTRLEFTRRFAQ